VRPDSTSTLDALVTSLLGDGAPMGREDRLVALSLYRLLANGRPVEVAALATAAAQDQATARAALSSWPDVSYDDDGRIIGFWGLDLRETAHRFELEDTVLYTWCAWDPLFLAPLLGVEACVESRCPVTGRTITLAVGPGGVGRVSPPEAVLSFMSECCDGASVITRFCRFVLLFASEEAARPWITERPGTFMLTIPEAFQLGRRMNAHRFGIAAT
jgi:alkylmercury lyase